MKIRNLAILGGLMVAAGMATVACSGDDDDDAVTPGKDAGTDTGVVVKLDAATDAAAAVPNHAAVLGFVQATVKDQFPLEPNLLSYFALNLQAGHSPTLLDVEECLAFQFGQVINNGDVYVGSVTTSGYPCRASMTDIHTKFAIPAPIFNEFISAIVTEGAAAGFTFTNAQTAAVLGLESQIVDPNAPDAAVAYGWNDAGDAGTVTDSGADAGDADAGPPP